MDCTHLNVFRKPKISLIRPRNWDMTISLKRPRSWDTVRPDMQNISKFQLSKNGVPQISKMSSLKLRSWFWNLPEPRIPKPRTPETPSSRKPEKTEIPISRKFRDSPKPKISKNFQWFFKKSMFQMSKSQNFQKNRSFKKFFCASTVRKTPEPAEDALLRAWGKCSHRVLALWYCPNLGSPTSVNPPPNPNPNSNPNPKLNYNLILL